MDKQPYSQSGNRYTTGNNLCRLTLAEFRDLTNPHVEAFSTARDILRSLKYLFMSGDRVLPKECEDAIRSLKGIGEESRKFQALIEHSDYLPLAIVPIRLPLIIALKEVELQVAKLIYLLDILYDEGWTTLHQRLGRQKEITHELEVLQVQNKGIVDHIGILSDRARFKEKVYSMPQ
jgi:hypothetical protein